MKATGVAKQMKDFYGEKLELSIYTNDSKEAQKYSFKSSTNVLIDQEVISLDIATDYNKMKDYISQRIV